MVVIFLPATAASRVTHERIAAPSACPVPAPPRAMPHPYLVPVRSTTSRSAHSSGMSAGASTAVSWPLMFKLGMGDFLPESRGRRPEGHQDKKSACAPAMPITPLFLPDPLRVRGGPWPPRD